MWKLHALEHIVHGLAPTRDRPEPEAMVANQFEQPGRHTAILGPYDDFRDWPIAGGDEVDGNHRPVTLQAAGELAVGLPGLVGHEWSPRLSWSGWRHARQAAWGDA